MWSNRWTQKFPRGEAPHIYLSSPLPRIYHKVEILSLSLCNTITTMDALLIICLFLVPVFILLVRRRSSKRLPPGSLGLPIVGQSLGLLRAMKANTAEKWLQERIDKYGPVSKLSLFGTPTVFIHGQAANKMVFTSDGSTLGNQQIESIQRILGDQTLLKLSGKDHKRVRDALSSFLKPESLKQHVKKMDEEIRSHLENNWQGQEKITVLNQMKTLTFDIICSLLFGLEQGPRRDSFVHNLSLMIDGVWSIPLDLPFSRYRRSLKASDRVQNMVRDLIAEKRVDLEKKGASPNQDLITRLLSLRGEDNEEVMSETEIVHNVLLTMVAGHETSSVVITFFMRLLANNPTVYEAVLKEQEEVAKSKPLGALLTWEDLSKMKYTWRVALEIMRVDPPVFGGFRRALKDIEYEGYIIPKGWQIFWVASMTHMDSNIFSDPTRFDPSRFENQGSIPPYSFIAFGAGYRICPGYEFAKMEILVAIHHLITRFNWKLCHTDNRFSRDPSPIPTEGLPVYLFPKN